MSHLICPLCGCRKALSIFDPTELDLDICLVRPRGLGRGRGFDNDDKISVLGDDEVTPQIVERVLSLCKLFIDGGLLRREVLNRRLGLADESGQREQRSAAEDRDSLRSELEEARLQLNKVNGYNRDWRKAYDTLKKERDRLGQDWQRTYDELARQHDAVASGRDKALSEVNVLTGKVLKLNRKIDEYESVVADSSEFLEGLEAKIEGHLDEERDPVEDIKDYIEEGLDKLIEDNESLRADREDE